MSPRRLIRSLVHTGDRSRRAAVAELRQSPRGKRNPRQPAGFAQLDRNAVYADLPVDVLPG